MRPDEQAYSQAASPTSPFRELAEEAQPQTALRAAITAAYRRPEPECVPALIAEAELPPALSAAARETARRLATRLRARHQHGIVETLLQEYALSSQEGVALMCLAEALLRIPDTPTRDALIRDKIGAGRLAEPSRRRAFALRQRRHLGPADHRQAHRHQQRGQPLHAAHAADRPGRRAAGARRGEHRHAADGRAVRARPDHCRGAGQ